MMGYTAIILMMMMKKKKRHSGQSPEAQSESQTKEH